MSTEGVTVSTGPHMEYETTLLRDGAGVDRDSADRASAAEAALRAGRVTASAFGDVGNAAVFAAQAVVTQQSQADGAAAAAAHREDQGVRADSAAAQGDGLTTATTAISASGSGRDPR